MRTVSDLSYMFARLMFSDKGDSLSMLPDLYFAPVMFRQRLLGEKWIFRVGSPETRLLPAMRSGGLLIYQLKLIIIKF